MLDKAYKLISKYFKNEFVFLAIIFFILILFLGRSLISQTYNEIYSFPLNFIDLDKSDISIINMNCKSAVLNVEIPVEGDYVSCGGSIKNNRKENFSEPLIKINNDYLLDTEYAIKETRFCHYSNGATWNSGILEDETKYCEFVFAVGKSGTHELQIEFEFQSLTNTSNAYTLSSGFEPDFMVYDNPTYQNWKSQKLSAFFLVIGAAFASFYTAKNLMDLCDRKVRKRCPHCRKSI
jgi:hypothetical protein